RTATLFVGLEGLTPITSELPRRGMTASSSGASASGVPYQMESPSWVTFTSGPSGVENADRFRLADAQGYTLTKPEHVARLEGRLQVTNAQIGPYHELESIAAE